MMPAVDAKKYSLSHFDNSDLWFNGNPRRRPTGWLGRWIDRNGAETNPLQAISIDTALSKSIRTASKPVCAIPSLSALGFTMNGSGYASPSGTASTVDVNAQMRALAGVPVGAGNTYLGARAARTASRWRPTKGRRSAGVPTTPSTRTTRRCRRA